MTTTVIAPTDEETIPPEELAELNAYAQAWDAYTHAARAVHVATGPVRRGRHDQRIKRIAHTTTVLLALQSDESASIREIQEACSIASTSTVRVALNTLERAGIISQRKKRARSRQVLV